jgi:hypothetical protein
MSDANKVFDLVEQLQEQHKAFINQREQVTTNLQQLNGAIFACDALIKQHEEAMKSQGETEHGDTINESAEQTAQE